MDTNKMRDISREQFEAWVLREWPDQSLARFTTGEYQGFTVEHCWQAWKASREAVVVDLPEGSDISDWSLEDQQVINRKEAIAAIESQGLKVAP